MLFWQHSTINSLEASEMPQTIQTELDEFILIVKHSFGQNLKSVIVYGSYARGDYNDRSDIDIMILVSLPEDEIKKTENTIYDMAFELELKYGKTLSPVIKNEAFFEYWADTVPFYRNIKLEGKRIE
jgi:predicted nucleotidyltransferase